jgi:hypothetical protein
MMRDRVGPAWAVALAGVMAVAFHPDAASAQRGPRVRTVEITPADAQIQVGQQQVFLANAYDAGNNPIATAVFTFTSSNRSIATVDANGIAVGLGRGTAIITARTGTGALAKSATATLTVAAPGAVIPQAAAPPAGPPAAAPLHPVPGRPTGPGYVAFDRQPPGSGPAEGLVIRPLRVVLVRGESRQLEYNTVNAEGQNAERVPIIFSVAPGGEHVVSVDSLGFIRAAGDTGRATARAEVPGNTRIQPRQVAIEVRGDSVRFARTEVWLPVGTVDTLRVEVPAQGRPINVRGEFQFSSSDEAKVRVAPLQPVVTALAPGTARILGESPYFNVGIQVHVLRPVAFFAATPADTALTLAMSATLPIVVRALAADSSVVGEAPLRWTLPDTNVARFDTTTRALRGVRAGETRLAVAAPATRDSSIERIWRIRVVAGGLAVPRSRVGLGLGERTPVTVQLLDERRQPIGPATNLRWTSSADSVARVADGQIQALRPGRARLTARTAWDSTITVDVFVAGLLLAPVQRGGRWDLYTFGADSVPSLVPVTQDASVELEPAWAPDLTRLAYVSAPTDRPTSLDLFVANADGSDPRRLTFDSATVGSPAFVGPSGDRLVFQSSRGGTPQIYVINRDATGRRALAGGPNPNSQPDVSPDGRKVLFVSLRQFPGAPRNYDIWEMNLDGTGERRMTTSPRPEDSPFYASDGRSFYYLRDDGGSPPSKRVYRQSVADSTGATAEPVTPAGMFVRAYSVGPDGTLLVLTKLQSVRGMGDVTQVVLFNPATSAAVTIHVGAGEQLAAPTFRPPTPQPR